MSDSKPQPSRLGDISTPASNGENRTITITYEADLLDSAVAGNARINSANVYGNQTDHITGTPATPPLPWSFGVQATPGHRNGVHCGAPI
ncbi:MAG: hypothetical protein GXP36_14450 [Actinobacteria bacterium]|nr:hypothetical protein [Actinomycetota bacterium]